MDKKRAEQLFEKYRNGVLTDKERLELNDWYLHHAKLSEPLTDEVVYKQQMAALDDAFPFRAVTPVKTLTWLPRLAAAAVILFTIGAGIYFYTDRAAKKTSLQLVAVHHDIHTGNNKAYLTLDNGKRILLTGAKNGTIAIQHGIDVTKTPGGEIIYKTINGDPASTSNEVAYNTIETPNGGQYQVYLPDGTHVWLNAASKLKYPTSFAGLGNRKVELSGEAYFEVAKDKAKPFIVSSKNQTVEVLGTHFNINAYADEATSKTMLLEGSVKISSNNISRILKPGQEASVSNDIIINDGDTEEAVAWKNGYFRFDDERLETVMRKIARWYDVRVTYKDDDLKNETFAAVSTRFANVTVLLKMLEQTGEAKFSIEDNKIIITRKK
jgi:transmembrane sensor